MQVDPGLTALGFGQLKLKHDESLPDFAFDFNPRLYTKLGRTLVMPKLWCGFDRWWAPHHGKIPGRWVIENNVSTDGGSTSNRNRNVGLRLVGHYEPCLRGCMNNHPKADADLGPNAYSE